MLRHSGRLLLTATIVACLGLAPIVASDVKVNAAVTDGPPVTLDETATAFAKQQGITIDEAKRALLDSAALIDAQNEWRDNNGFGAVWVTYDGGYQVHLRYITDEFLRTSLPALESRLGHKLVLHQGGASVVDSRRIAASLESAKIPYSIDTVSGMVTAFADDAKVVVPSPFLTVAVSGPPVVQGGEEAHAGADVQYADTGFAGECTAGFIWGGFGITGYTTAAHCRPAVGSSYTWVDGRYSSGSAPIVSLACGNLGDYQFVKFSTAVDEDETFYDKRTAGWPATSYQIAGGWYVNQPTLKIGLAANGSVGSNTGKATDYATYAFQGGTCPGVRKALRYDNNSAGGDSGGPIYLSYGGGWYLGAIHNRAYPPFRYGTAIWDISLPNFSSIHVCYSLNPCG